MSGRLRAKIRNISAVQTPIPLTAVSASVTARQCGSTRRRCRTATVQRFRAAR